MPIPEPSLYRPSNLTRQQQQDQLAACYGVNMPQMQLTQEEIERMRAIVMQHDANHQPIQTIDLNNPPKQPYRFQEFPKMLYAQTESGQCLTNIVRNKAEQEAALADGWSEQPIPVLGQAIDEHLSPAYQAEAARVQEQINESNRRRKHNAA